MFLKWFLINSTYDKARVLQANAESAFAIGNNLLRGAYIVEYPAASK